MTEEVSEVMATANENLRDRLKAVREQIGATRDERAAARRERDAAKEKFGNANHDGPVTEWAEFGEAEAAVAKCGQLEDKLADLTQAEKSILQMLGEEPAANHQESGVVTSHGWSGHALLGESGSSYLRAREAGVFSSSAKFGTIQLGQIASREEAVQAFSYGGGGSGGFQADLPDAAPGVIGTPNVAPAIRPDYRGVLPPVLRRLTFLDLIPKGTTDSNSIEYVQVATIPGDAAPVAEGAVKPQEGLTLTDATAPVRTIAGWIKVNRQAMDDMAGLATLINTLLPYDVRRQIEAQILTGDGTGQNLLGIYNQSGLGAPAFVTGDNPADAILRAMTVVILNDADPNFVVANPLMWQDIMLMREGSDTNARAGAYLGGGPFSFTAPTIWGLALTPSRAVPQGSPLVGDSNGATLLFREAVNVKTSDSDQDDFVRNRVTVLAEARVAFPVWRPASFAIGDTTA